jgi:hypothetical protein
METLYRQYSISLGASSSAPLAGLNLPAGVYKVEVFSLNGTSVSISVDQAAIAYEYYQTNAWPNVVAIVSPDPTGGTGVLSLHIQNTTASSFTATGVIVITPLRSV